MGDVQAGARCVVERRMSSGAIDHRHEAVVVRVTEKRAYLSASSWFALSDAKREVRPRYLDYRSHVVSIEAALPEGDGA